MTSIKGEGIRIEMEQKSATVFEFEGRLNIKTNIQKE